MRFIALLFLALVGLFGRVAVGAEPDYVGSTACAACHPAATSAWQDSQHAGAMSPPDPAHVLGDFSGARLDHHGSATRFYRDGARYMVETPGKDGQPAKFAIAFTFGIAPLQQYLVAFPDGRLQALPWAWDSRPKADGGQRWFHLYPDAPMGPDDALYWTGPNQNWNFMCADCHATAVVKNYDAAGDRFATRYIEPGVGCEGCHGPGSAHLAWAKSDRPGEAGKGLTASLSGPAQLDSCGRCHGRFSQFAGDWRPDRPLIDSHFPSFLTADLFESDGQMRDEVFNLAPFQQSKMFRQGVVCANCHEPHGGTLKAPGDQVCAQCHVPADYTQARHGHHATVATGAPGCIDCHMPARTYMVIDRRHDHSFRVPRPDLTAATGAPSACTDCHKDKSADWAAQAVNDWFGPTRKGYQTYAPALAAARAHRPTGRALLDAVARNADQPAIARATALVALRDYPAPATLAIIAAAASDPDPTVRLAALLALDGVPAAERTRLAVPRLDDPARAVRIEAANLLADIPPTALPADRRAALDRATAEYIAAQTYNADRAEARANLGGFYARRGDLAAAEAQYRAGIALMPTLAAPRIGLADLQRRQGRDGDAVKTLQDAVAAIPDSGAARHALGLALVRLKRYDEALVWLRQAAERDPADPRFAYVYAVALKSGGQADAARQTLVTALARHPDDASILSALLQDALETGRRAEALVYARRLKLWTPDSTDLDRLIARLQASVPTR